jgi:flagellar export protein FliJ
MADDDRTERFDALVDVYKHHERQRAKKLSAADRIASTERDRLSQLDNVRSEYREELAGAQSGGIAATALKNWRRFMHGLDRAHVEQTTRVARADEVREARHGEWLVVRRRVKGFEHLADGLKEAARKAADRIERKLMDEIAGRRDGAANSSMLKSRQEGQP